MATPTQRPSRVVIVDADNPMVEVTGEFFWREDHESIVAAERQRAYRDGYAAGRADASAGVVSQTVMLRRRPTLLGRIRRLVLGLTLLSLLVIVLAVIAGQLLSQR